MTFVLYFLHISIIYILFFRKIR